MDDFRFSIDDDLALLPPLPHHAAAEFAAIERGRDRIRRFMPFVDRVKSVDGCRAFLSTSCRGNGANEGLVAQIEHRGDIAGIVALHSVRHDELTGEISYWLADGFEGYGLATRSAAAVAGHARAAIGLRRIEIRTSSENVRSQAVARRLGYELEATLRAGDPLPDGRVTDQLVFADVRDPTPADRPIEWTLSTGATGVVLTLPMPHRVAEAFAVIETDRQRLSHWLAWPTTQLSIDDTRSLVRRAWELAADGGGIQAHLLLDGRLAGGVGLRGISPVGRRASVGYWLASFAEGRGAATAGVTAMSRYVFDHFDVVRLELIAGVDNARSIAVAERSGFKREGRMRAEYVVAGQPVDTYVYGRIRTDA